MYSNNSTSKYTKDFYQQIKTKIQEADAVVIGAGAGLSASAGLLYSGRRFTDNFSDFIEKYKLQDMYSAAFYRYANLEEYFAYWSRHISINRYEDLGTKTYSNLFDLVRNKEYFVLTTNVDHLFIRNGFDKKRVFYTQGNYGLWQCSKPCHDATYDNYDDITKMLEQQKNMQIPSELIPYCPKCGAVMTTNLRKDSDFVEDYGWREASERYTNFLNENSSKKVLFLELGVGFNTPTIIKYSFWRMVYNFESANLVTINIGDIEVPDEISKKTICVNHDIDEVLENLNKI